MISVDLFCTLFVFERIVGPIIRIQPTGHSEKNGLQVVFDFRGLF